MCPSLIQIGSKTAEKNSAQTNRQTNRRTDRHYENNGHLAVNQYLLLTGTVSQKSMASFHMTLCQQNLQPQQSFCWFFYCISVSHYHHHHHNPFSGTTAGEPVPEETFWTLWCKGRLTEADTLTIQLGATPAGLTSAHLHHPPIFFYRPDALPATQPTVSKH